MEKDDLKLEDLAQYTGTTKYHKIGLFRDIYLTDGVVYIMRNGYSWFVTDMLSMCMTNVKIKKQPFLVFKLKVKEGHKADVKITNGNKKVFFNTEYRLTDAKRDLTLFLTNNVLMLSNEY